MTIAAMKDYFSHRELGIQGAVGEYAILVPLVQWEGKLCLLFETRAETLVGHQPGEVCFPGGRREAGEKPVDTALRETWEEIGIPPEAIEILAPLDVIQDISDRVIYPFLGLVSPAGAGPPGRQRGGGEERVLRPPGLPAGLPGGGLPVHRVRPGGRQLPL